MEEETCVVCYERAPAMLVRECMHACMCVNCAFGVFVKQKSCPLCRAPMLSPPVYTKGDPEAGASALAPTFVSEAIAAARCHAEKGVEPKAIRMSLRNLVDFVPESSMRSFVRAYQTFSEKNSHVIALALESPKNVALQKAAAAECHAALECDPADAANALLDARCSAHIAVACLKIVEVGLRSGIVRQAYAAITAAREKFRDVAEVQGVAILAASTAARSMRAPPRFFANALMDILSKHGDDASVRERVCQFFGAVTFIEPEPIDTWTVLVSIAASLFSSKLGAADTMRLLRFFYHAGSAGEGSWEDMCDVTHAAIARAIELNDHGVDKWIMAIAEATLCFPESGRAFIDSGGLEYLATAAETTLAHDQSSLRKLARIVKGALPCCEGVSRETGARLAQALNQADSWPLAWDAVHVLRTIAVVA